MLRRLTLLAIALATASLVAGFLLAHNNAGVFASLLIGLTWVVMELTNRHWAAASGLVFFIILAVVGAFKEYYAILDALAVVAALSAWDLARFRQRLRLVEDDPSWTDAARHHVRRLLLVNGAGVLAAVLAINLQVGGPFALVWFLAVGAVIALFALVMWMARMTQ